MANFKTVLPDDMQTQLRCLAVAKGTTMGALVQEALTQYFATKSATDVVNAVAGAKDTAR